MCAAAAAMVTAGLAPASSTEQTERAAADSTSYQVKELVRGAPIHGANGLAVHKDGRLLVASVFGAEIVALDRQTGQVMQRLGHDKGVDAPDDVAVGPDGAIYWTDIIKGEVGRLSVEGTVTKAFVAPGMNPLAFSSTGRLFVGQAFFGDGLYELDPVTLAIKKVLIADTGGTGPWPNQLNGFDFGPDGMLYSPQPFLGRIVRINPETGAITQLTAAFAANPPTSVEFDSKGRLHASLSDGTIVRVDRQTGTHQVFTKIRSAVLDNMAFDARDRLFVSDSDNGAVYRVSPGGGVRRLSPGGLILPGGLAVMPGATGRASLFVANVWSLVELDARSGQVLDVDRQSRTGGGIIEAWSVSPDNGKVVISSWMSAAVQVWDPIAGTAVRTVPGLAAPLNAVRFQGDLFVGQLGTGTVVRVNASGGISTVASGLVAPTGIAVTADDLWVADWATGKIWQIVADNVTLPAPKLVAQGLHGPEGMAVDVDGSLLVVESGTGQLSRVQPMTGDVSPVATGLETGLPGSAAAPPTWALSSVAVGQHGTIFVTGDRGNVVYRLSPLPAS